MEHKDRIYQSDLGEIKKVYQDTKDWAEVLSRAVHSDCDISQEAFIDYVEEVYKTKVKDVKHLQKLTGITHLSGSDGKEAKTEAEAQRFAIKELEEIILACKYSKYSTALRDAIESGAKYKDLLAIKPADYGLPEKWSGHASTDQYSTVLFVISTQFLIYEPQRHRIAPDLRSIADELEAPYSVILEAKIMYDI